MRVRVALDPTLLTPIGDGTLMDEIYTDQFGRLWTVPSGIGVVSRTVITATGAGTYTVPAGVKGIIVEIIAGGGGGGGVPSPGAGLACYASGGGGGGYVKRIYSAPLAVSYPVNVGAGGAGGAAGANNGVAGGNTTFGSGGDLITAFGGNLGQTMAAAATVLFVDGGGHSAVGTGGNIQQCGSQGGHGIRINGVVGGGMSGIGGAAGDGGGGGNSRSGLAGEAGPSPGSGGSGGAAVNPTTLVAGGAGANGIIVITEFS